MESQELFKTFARGLLLDETLEGTVLKHLSKLDKETRDQILLEMAFLTSVKFSHFDKKLREYLAQK